MASILESERSGELEGVEGQSSEKTLNAREVEVRFDGMQEFQLL